MENDDSHLPLGGAVGCDGFTLNLSLSIEGICNTDWRYSLLALRHFCVINGRRWSIASLNIEFTEAIAAFADFGIIGIKVI